MKWLLITAMMAGTAGAADFADLQKMDAAAVAAQAGGWQQIPGFEPWNPHPGQPYPFPQPPHGSIEICENTKLENGKCFFKCEGGEVIKEEPVRPGVCATHIFRPVPSPFGNKGLKTMDNWNSVDLTADDGTVVSLDYVPADLGGTIKATRVWISVRNPGFTGGEAVSARLTNYYETGENTPGAARETSEISLPYNGWSFQAKFPDLDIFQAHHSWTHSFRQELAVFVNGRRLTDGTGAPAFNLKLPGRPQWADEAPWGGDKKATSSKAMRYCSFSGTTGETCSYSCSDGSSYARPMKRPSPFGDEPVVPCPAVVFTF